MVDTLEDSLIGVRDRALLLIGFAGAFRRSELVGLDLKDVHTGHDGLTVFIRKSKTDQEGQGRKVGIPYGSHPHTCPVQAYGTWLEKCGLTEGPLFRSVTRHGKLQLGRLSDRAVALIVKRTAKKAGLDPDKYACGRVWRPVRLRRGFPSVRSWRRRATGAWLSLGATSGMAPSFGTTPPPRSGYK